MVYFHKTRSSAVSPTLFSLLPQPAKNALIFLLISVKTAVQKIVTLCFIPPVSRGISLFFRNSCSFFDNFKRNATVFHKKV